MSHWHEDGRDDYWERYDDMLDDAKTTGNMEEVICSACNGSGEGSYEGTICRACKGSGLTWVEVDESDLEGQDEGELQPRGV
jgi:hypothetical protein